MSSIIVSQFEAIKGLEAVFDDSTYRITSHVRINGFKIEKMILEGMTKERDDRAEDVKKFEDQLAKTTRVLRYNIEIAEEGDSKAILVFTLVTIVFLPLSFVASLFGMNTVDIRDMTNSQVLFWEVALPLTAIIGGLSLLFAYGGTQIGEWYGKVLENMRQNRSRSGGNPTALPTLKIRSRDEEEPHCTGPKMLPAPDTLRQRKPTVEPFVTPAKLMRQPTKPFKEEELVVKRSSAGGERWYGRNSRRTSFSPKRNRGGQSRVVVEGRRSPRPRSIVVEERLRAPGDDVVEVIEESEPHRYRETEHRRQRRSSPKPVVGIKEMFF